MRVRRYSAKAMKITLKLYQPNSPQIFQDANYHEDMAGVTTGNDLGKFRVKKINTVAVSADGSVVIYADLIDRDLIKKVEPVLVLAEPLAKVERPNEWPELPASPYVPGCESREEPSF